MVRVEEGRVKKSLASTGESRDDADARLVRCSASHLWGREAGHSVMLAIGEKGCREVWRQRRVRRARRARRGVRVGGRGGLRGEEGGGGRRSVAMGFRAATRSSPVLTERVNRLLVGQDVTVRSSLR